MKYNMNLKKKAAQSRLLSPRYQRNSFFKLGMVIIFTIRVIMAYVSNVRSISVLDLEFSRATIQKL